ncbi:hypothetical protein BGZ65_004561, partial [Modicella reniformis]
MKYFSSSISKGFKDDGVVSQLGQSFTSFALSSLEMAAINDVIYLPCVFEKLAQEEAEAAAATSDQYEESSRAAQA